MRYDGGESITPEKSIIEVRRYGRATEVGFKMINRKGTFMLRPECLTCNFAGRVHYGFGFRTGATCDRDLGTWRAQKGNTSKPCTHRIGKSVVLTPVVGGASV